MSLSNLEFIFKHFRSGNQTAKVLLNGLTPLPRECGCETLEHVIDSVNEMMNPAVNYSEFQKHRRLTDSLTDGR